MSPRIKELPEDLVARIAAGEVVERPASILKELIENSLDAGATAVSIHVEGAGRTRISVSDNGCGMTKEEARLALRRHATSKISSFEDMETIKTFGFRGEALPSIAAVSKLELTTRATEEDTGWEIAVSGGKLLSQKPAPREPGTTIHVRDLFYNTPARYKFLKSDATERAQCLRVIEELVFGALDATFHLQMENAKPLVFKANTGPGALWVERLKTRVAEAWGARWEGHFQPVDARSDHFRLNGILTDPGHHQATPKYQYLYINRRPVQNRRLTRALYDGYLGQLPSLRHPAWVLFLDIDPRTVDVNVHPSKREVKLAHESEIFEFLLNAVKGALSKTPHIPVDVFSRPAESSFNSGSYKKPSSPAAFLSEPGSRYGSKPVSSEVSAALDSLFKTNTSSPMVAVDARQIELQDIRNDVPQPLAQLNDMFILAQSTESLVILDQHAAAEKILYERLLGNLKTQEPPIQMLLVPFSWDVSLALKPLVQENLPVLKAMGFMMEPFGGNTFLVKGYPAHLNEKFDLHSLLDGISDVLSEPTERNGTVGQHLEHRLAAMTACKGSVKAGDRLDLKECLALIKQLVNCEAPFTCPHGRPTMIKLPFSDLERRFRR